MFLLQAACRCGNLPGSTMDSVFGQPISLVGQWDGKGIIQQEELLGSLCMRKT